MMRIKLEIRTFNKLLVSFFLLIFISCTKDSFESVDNTFNLNEFEEYIENPNHSSNYIYDQNKLHRFDIYINQQNLDILNNNPTAEEYVEGSLVFEGKIVSNVGVRYKGSVGAWVGCLSGNNWSEPSGYKTCPKLSMKIKFNWGNERKFYGLNKLQFHSQNLDRSKMHERLGYYMFRNFGVIAPRSNHAIIYINGEQKQKAADLFLAAFLLRPLEGREEPNEALERPKFIQWMNISERRNGAATLDDKVKVK